MTDMNMTGSDSRGILYGICFVSQIEKVGLTRDSMTETP